MSEGPYNMYTCMNNYKIYIFIYIYMYIYIHKNIYIYIHAYNIYIYISTRHEGGQASSGHIAVTRTTTGHRVRLYGGNWSMRMLRTRVAYIREHITHLLTPQTEATHSVFCYGTNVPGFLNLQSRWILHSGIFAGTSGLH